MLLVVLINFQANHERNPVEEMKAAEASGRFSYNLSAAGTSASLSFGK